MIDFSKKSHTEKYFSSLKAELNASKIKSVFSLSSPTWNSNCGFRRYSTDTEVYILFENEMCLVVDYRFVDFLNVEYRKLTQEEKDLHETLLIKDFFNTRNDIYSHREKRIYQVQICELEYGYIENVCLRSVTDEYSKWVDDNLNYVEPTEETFDEIKITMSNGKSIVICADEADVDGYVMIWSEDTDESVIDVEEMIERASQLI